MNIVRINLLDSKNWLIMKEIYIVSQKFQNQEIGVIRYLRTVDEKYKMKEDTKTDMFLKYFDYPKQELFPEDDLDKIILTSIKEQFSNSYVQNRLLLFDIDRDMINTIKQTPRQTAVFDVMPLGEQNDLAKYGNEFEFFRKEINIYQYYIRESIKNNRFIGYCDFDSCQDTYKRLDEIEFL
ncbi:hypothetical protein [Prevotella intermedia]|uniref:Uncharacterized protein n=1 Tax=Prevotella intermedia TaxID=28131 RepID=A0A2D3L4A9_PREIN|nr:hypothetical protein [Prevotella intermedia]ATV25331.1 hypothetical protein CTM62_00370 [Prevotella intermedia]